MWLVSRVGSPVLEMGCELSHIYLNRTEGNFTTHYVHSTCQKSVLDTACSPAMSDLVLVIIGLRSRVSHAETTQRTQILAEVG